MPNLITTDNIRKTDRADYWRDAICRSFVELDCADISEDKEFFGHIKTHDFSQIKFSTVTSSKQHVLRSQSRIKKSYSDVFLLSLQVAGQGIVRQHDRQAILKTGDMALYDTTKQYELYFDNDFSQIVMKIPRFLAKKYLGVPEKLTALTLDHTSGCGLITGRMIQNVCQEGTSLCSEQQDILSRSLMELLGANFQNNNLDIARNMSTTRHTRLLMIKDYIQNNLTDYNLTPKIIADEFGISTRYLSKIFAEDGHSVSRWLYDKRLEKSREDMTNSLLTGLTISEIAFKWGFNDMSHFSRSFKAKYACSPREYRKMHTAR